MNEGCAGKTEIPWERMPYLSALEACSRRGAIQIHVLPLWMNKSVNLLGCQSKHRTTRNENIFMLSFGTMAGKSALTGSQIEEILKYKKDRTAINTVDKYRLQHCLEWVMRVYTSKLIPDSVVTYLVHDWTQPVIVLPSVYQSCLLYTSPSPRD